MTLYNQKIEGLVERKGIIENVTTRHGETKVCNAWIESNWIYSKLILWGDYAESIHDGDNIMITDATVDHSPSGMIISTTRKSIISVTD